jgi:hypothetical protein
MPFEDINDYGYQKVNEIISRGFIFLGWAPDVKGDKYRVNYGFLISPDGEYFVQIGTGKIVGIHVNSTTIYSRLEGERAFCTTDNPSSALVDISRRDKSQLIQKANFITLWERHCDWLKANNIKTVPFDQGSELICLNNMRNAKYQRMIDLGQIIFIDSSKTWWRYTLIGAVQATLLNFLVGTARGLTDGSFPKVI